MNKMKNKKTISLVTSIVLSISLFGVANVAYAQTLDDSEYTSTINELRESFGYTYSYDNLDAQINQVSQETGQSKLEIAKNTLTQSRKYETGYSSDSMMRANNSGRHNDLADAANSGDVFVSEGNNTFGWNHGHTGIFSSRTTVIEAVGLSGPARHVGRRYSSAAGKSLLQRVNTSQTNRNKAVSRARTYIGRGYNADIIHTNRNDWGGLNCSQLVWASYMYGAGIDLAPRDNFVYPYSIRDSSWTTTYRVLN